VLEDGRSDLHDMETETAKGSGVPVRAPLNAIERLEHVKLPGMLEGGEVIRVGVKKIFWTTQRSTAEGIRQLVYHGALRHMIDGLRGTGCLH